MVEENDDNKQKETEGQEGRGGGGRRSGGGGGGGIKLPPNKLQEIMANWEHLDMTQAILRVAEFFTEMPARASANLQVTWTGVAKQSYAIVNHLISFGQEVSQLLRERDRTAGQVRRLRRWGIRVRPGHQMQRDQPQGPQNG
ncbi:MAG: hypothetical protein JO126_06510 [Alphaproteobacteria bacterium]|nr:hypothetical protein [Alphaproteobacteria bacterium]MBV8549090.1 hypothetical protein [Alphaproteobacteria bacterium]